jgi:predicted Zn-dependent peptidase
VLGGLEELRDLDHDSLLAFYRQRFVTGNMVLVVCGDVRPDETQDQAATSFAALPVGGEQLPSPVAEPVPAAPRTVHLERDLNQVHLLVGAPTVSMKHEDRSALKVAERVLGMGFSARLYRRLRQKARLVYNIRTAMAHYEDAGYFAVWGACSPQRVAQVQAAILEEWARLGDEGLHDDELRAAKSNYSGTLVRRFETNWAMAGIHGVEGLLHRVEPFEEAVARIGAVRSKDVQRVAREYLQGDVYVAVTLGRSNG